MTGMNNCSDQLAIDMVWTLGLWTHEGLLPVVPGLVVNFQLRGKSLGPVSFFLFIKCVALSISFS